MNNEIEFLADLGFNPLEKIQGMHSVEITLKEILKKYSIKLKLCGVGVMLPKNEKLWSMAGIIANRIQVALSEDLILDKQQFDDLQEEWFDWLEDKISGN